MVHIPAGSFTMGTSDQQIDWLAHHTGWAKQWRDKEWHVANGRTD
jgi:hypothetical protein